MRDSPVLAENCTQDLELSAQLRCNTKALYNLPIRFWKEILGSSLHFHLGHFPNSDTSLEEAMSLAVFRLAEHFPRGSVSNVLDIGCGWGGPAFDLARRWSVPVLGLTLSSRQSRYVNTEAQRRALPVSARTADVEYLSFMDRGSFTLAWLYDCLDHIPNRAKLLRDLHDAARDGSYLAVSMHCRSREVPKNTLYNEFMGIQPPPTADELVKLVQDSGWQVIHREDCSVLTGPVWKLWIENTAKPGLAPFRDQANELALALAATEELYKRGMLEAIQLSAKR